MQKLKSFFIVLAGLFVFITLMGLLIPSNVKITRAVVVNAPVAKLYPEISDLNKWINWQPVFKANSANIHFLNNGDKAEWESKGKTNIIEITERKNNAVLATLTRPGDPTTFYSIGILPLPDTTQVQVEWNVMIKLRWYPWEKFYGIFIEKISGQGYEDALNSLKEYAESR